jgi:Chaperone of endosialidase
MSKLPVDPYNRTYIVEAPLDNPDRAPLGGTGKDFVVTLSDNVETPGSDMMFLSRSGKWVPFTTTDLVTWGSITGDITEQADLMAMFAQYTPTTGYHSVAFSGNYNELNNLPPLGTVSPLNLNGATSMFLRGDGVWAIPVDVNAEWGNITGNINAQTDLIALLDLKAPITSPVFQGNPQAPTPPKDNNSKSIATTEWFFGQAFNGVPQMDGVGSSGNSTLWARGNHVHPTDTTKIGDAPNDGQQYARQSQTWTVVTGGGGGGGGVWIGDAPPSNPVTYPFWWSSTTLQLAIWYNDGNSSQWVDTNAEPDTLQGASGPWLLADGTVAAPGLAWASEPGLGWYRPAAGQLGVAHGGAQKALFDFSVASTSRLTLKNATAAGASVLGLDSAVGGLNSVVGYKAGGARWEVILGNVAAEGSGSAGSDFTVGRYTNAGAFIDSPMKIARADAATTFLGAVYSPTFFIDKPGGSSSEGALYARKNGVALARLLFTDASDNISFTTFDDSGGFRASPLSINRGNSWVYAPSYFINASHFSGDNTTSMIVGCDAFGVWPNLGGGTIVLRGTAHSQVGAGSVSCYSGTGNTGMSLLPNANAWSAGSDERLKDIDSDVTNAEGLAAVLAMRPIRYRYKSSPDTPLQIGLTAQSVKPNVPEAVSEAPMMGADGKLTTEAFMQLRLQEVIPHMIAAMKELNTRIAALEAKP